MFSKRTVVFIVIVTVVTVNILVLTIASQRLLPVFGPGRITIPFVATIQKGISLSIRFAKDIWRHYFFLVSVSKENEVLKKSLQEALKKSHEFGEVAQANKRLRKLLRFQSTLKRPVLSAEIIGKDPSPWYKTITIDKGSSGGVKKGYPVVIAEGVAGIVTDVTSQFSKVLLIIDQNSAVDALIQKTRARGILKGGPDRCQMQYVLRKYEVAVGDTVITSGLDGVFPKGLRIGYVSSVIKPHSGIFQEIYVTPFVDFEGIEEVLIILNDTDNEAEKTS